MSDTDQNSAKKESVQLLGLWAVTMLVAIIFISSLSTRTSESVKNPAEAKHVQATEATAPPLDLTQTMPPLPAGHPSIEQLQAEAALAPPALPELPAGHPPLDGTPAAAPAVAPMQAPVETQ